MKRVTYIGKQQSYRTEKFVWDKKKRFNDMTEEEAKAFEGRDDFKVSESPKYPSPSIDTKIEKKAIVGDSEEGTDDHEDEDENEESDEEENEEDSEEEKEIKKKKKKVKKVK